MRIISNRCVAPAHQDLLIAGDKSATHAKRIAHDVVAVDVFKMRVGKIGAEDDFVTGLTEIYCQFPIFSKRLLKPADWTIEEFHVWYRNRTLPSNMNRLLDLGHDAPSGRHPSRMELTGLIGGVVKDFQHEVLNISCYLKVGYDMRNMKIKRLAILSVLALSTLLSAQTTQPAPPEPILEGFTADPHAVVFGDTYYVYPTSDKPNWQTTDFSVWSSKDLINWKNEGMVLDVTKDLTWAKICAWAPAAISRNGKYYFYFAAEQKIGVAVADKPTGPFVDALGKPMIVPSKEYPGQAIDVFAYIDDDGQAYLYWGQGNMWVQKLKEDMITLEGTPQKLTPKRYNEGTFVIKRNGTYYFSWSENDARSPDYRIAYGTAKSPLGPIELPENNVILKKNGPAIGTGHHSIINVPGTDHWYMIYHRHAIPDGSGYKRQTCIGKMEFDADGKILPVDPMKPAFEPGSKGEPISIPHQ